MDLSKEVKVNKCFFRCLLGVIAIQIVVIAYQYDYSDSSKDYRSDLNISEAVQLGYPEIICQGANSHDYLVYKANEYRFLPDIYNKENFLVSAIDENGTIIAPSFSTTRCVVNDTLKLLKDR